MSYNHTATKWRAAGTRGAPEDTSGQLSNWERRFRGAGDLDSTCSAAGVLMAPTPHGAQPGWEAQQGTGQQAPLRESSSPTWARMPSTIRWKRHQSLGPFLRWLPLSLSADGSSSEMRSFHSQSRSSLGLQCFTHKNQNTFESKLPATMSDASSYGCLFSPEQNSEKQNFTLVISRQLEFWCCCSQHGRNFIKASVSLKKTPPLLSAGYAYHPR